MGRKGWFVLTRDRRIQRREVEISALIEAGVGSFIFIGGNLLLREMIDVLVKALPEIERLALSTPRPFLYRIYKNGEIVGIEI